MEKKLYIANLGISMKGSAPNISVASVQGAWFYWPIDMHHGFKEIWGTKFIAFKWNPGPLNTEVTIFTYQRDYCLSGYTLEHFKLR